MKGFWIPVELMEIDISWTKRILLAEISQLEMLDKGCIASNSHFANKLKLSNQAVSKALNELDKDGLIIINNAQTKRNFGRTITINFGKSSNKHTINFSKSCINFSKSDVHESGETKENIQVNIQSNKTIVATKKSSDDSIRLANYLLQHIHRVNPTFKQPNINTWAKDIDLAIRIDGRTVEEITRCIEWIYTDKGEFWQKNILSGKKLREKFDTMNMQIISIKSNSKPKQQEESNTHIGYFYSPTF